MLVLTQCIVCIIYESMQDTFSQETYTILFQRVAFRGATFCEVCSYILDMP